MNGSLAAALGAVAAGVTMTWSAAPQNASDAIVAKRRIVIAVPSDLPPYGFVGTDLKPQGLDVDMARLIGTRLGATVELVPLSRANRIPSLQARQVDLVVAALGRSPEGDKAIDFSAAYAPFFQAVFAPKSLAIRGPADLAGRSVGVTRGAVEDRALGHRAPPGTGIRRFEDNNATVSAFVSGQVQAIATDVSVASDLVARHPQLGAELKFVLEDASIHFGLAKGEDLRLQVDEIVAAAKASGELDRLATKWLGRPAGVLLN